MVSVGAPGSPLDRRDELRLALTLNGGVSLAVWMGGAVEELDALRCAPYMTAARANHDTESVYGALLAALQLRVEIDIIAGTSAGGLNGAALGTAIAARRRLTDMRGMWMRLA